ncbi:MAG: hypothetical protein LAP87_20775 [Acidobacteriia bacterium]|nr:hypothetical protein [Terriglobia bacterium]
MIFYSPTEWSFTRQHREEVKMVLSGIDCVLDSQQVIYCSSEITSGANLYAAMRRHHVKCDGELKQIIGEAGFKADIMEPNMKAANQFAEAVRCAFPQRTIVITPAPFVAPGWIQREYLALWEELLRTRIKSCWFNRNWEFSNGCTFEFAVALDAGLPTFDQDGQALDRQAGIHAVEAAVLRLESEGFHCVKLRENLDRMRAAGLGA